MTKIALSGAAGNMGKICAWSLPSAASTCVRPAAEQPLKPMHPGEDVMHGDLRDPAVVDRLLHGVDVLIHMAGTSVERPLPEIIENNLRRRCTRCTKARAATSAAHRVRELEPRVRHVPGRRQARARCAFRPDGFYGLSKVWGEAMARMYWDKHGIEGISLRIGSCIGKPHGIPPPQHLVRPRRPGAAHDALHRRARHRLYRGVGHLGQYAQLLEYRPHRTPRLSARTRTPRTRPKRS